jgi:hypothetical protein
MLRSSEGTIPDVDTPFVRRVYPKQRASSAAAAAIAASAAAAAAAAAAAVVFVVLAVAEGLVILARAEGVKGQQ